jgi:hypothetical protein
LRIFQGTDYKDFTPGIAIPEKDWDEAAQLVEPTCPDSKSHNAILGSNKSRLKKILHLAELESKPHPSLDIIILSGFGHVDRIVGHYRSSSRRT